MGPVEYRYELTLQTFQDFNVWITAKAYKRANIYRYLMGAAILLFGLFLLYQNGFERTPIAVGLIVGGLYTLVLGQYFMNQGAKKRAVEVIKQARPGTIIGHQKLVFAEEGITQQTEQSTLSINWGGIHSVEQAKKFVVVLITPVSGFIIPKEEIGNDAAVKELIDFVNAQIQRSYNKDEIANHLLGAR